MTKRAAIVALACAVVGLAASGAAAYTHYHLLNDPNYRSFCDVSERFSCSQVYMSRFSTVLGIPVAIFGALWFVVASLLSITGMSARETVRESVPGYLFVMSTLALAVVLYLGYASFMILGAVCVLCRSVFRRCGHDGGVLPARGRADWYARDAAAAAGLGRSALGARALHGHRAARAARRADRRREGPRGQVQRLPVSGMRAVVFAVQVGAGEVPDQ
jgi:uncharacterized membrane protein